MLKHTLSEQNIYLKKKSLFTLVVIKWDNIDHKIRNPGSFSVFEYSILKFIEQANQKNQTHNKTACWPMSFVQTQAKT